MDLTSLQGLSDLAAYISGGALLVLGIWTLKAGDRRPRGGTAFGAFAVAWGMYVILGNLGSGAESLANTRLLLLGSLPFLFLLPYFTIEFAHGRSGPRHRDRIWRWLRLSSGLLAVAGPTILLLAPDMILQGVTQGQTGPVVDWGPYYPVLHIAFFSALAVTIVMLQRAHLEAATPRTASRAFTLVAGLALYLGFASGYYLAFYGGWAMVWGPSTANVPFALLFGALTLISLGMAARSLARARTSGDEALARRSKLLAAALLVPLVWGVLEGAARLNWFPRVNSAGLWRTAGVAIMAYGVAQWHTFELPEKVRRLAVGASGATGATVAGALGFVTVSLISSGSTMPTAAALATSTMGVLPGVHLGRRVFDQGINPVDHEEVVYQHRIDSYRAALEAALARGTLEEDEPFLTSLRERYGITEDEDRILRYYARGSVVAHRDDELSSAYERVRLLGEGGGGRTWLARDRTRERLAVLKEPLPSWQQEPGLRQRFLEEARMAAKVRHPNVVSIVEVLEDDGRPIIVMEHVEGGSLSDLLVAKGALDWRRALSILYDIATGLEAVHQRGITHRDVKPSNVLLTEDGRAKLADFGIAHETHTGGQTVILGQDEPATAGTKGYIAPEVEDGTHPGDERADIYGCGALLHHCLYGAPPRERAQISIEADVPPEVDALLAKATARAPQQRYQDARALADAIEETIQP